MDKKYKFETLAVHGGQSVDPVTRARGINVCRSAAFVFNNAEQASNLFALKEFGNIYSRMTNPTVATLEDRVTLLEGGAASVAVSSGTSAVHYAIINIASQGDEIVSGSNLYGGTYTMFDAIMPQFGIGTKFADVRDPKTFEKAITDKTKLLYVETIGNPGLDVADIGEIGKIAHNHGLPLIVDGTFTTPYLLRTIEHGADIVINSLTKWMGGHGAAIGGVITDSGKFDWGNGKFKLFSEPDPNYHGMRWAKDLPAGLREIAFALRFRTVPLRNLGACLAPDNAWIILQGIESLPFRMARHCENAFAVAKYLESHPKVEWVRYSGLEKDASHKTAVKYLKKGFGGMVVFGVKGGRVAGEIMMDNLELIANVANVGDAKTIALHPASTSHSQMTDEQQKAAGLPPELIRLSVGLEHIDDIIGDLENGLKKI